MDRRIRNRILIFLLLAGVIAFVLVELNKRQPAVQITAVAPARANIASSIVSNGKVEPIAPVVIRAQLDTFVERVAALAGQQVKKGQLLLELDVKDAAAQLAQARAKLLHAQSDLRTAEAGGKPDEAVKVRDNLAKAVAERDRLQREHDSLERLVAKQAATKDELAANELALQDAQRQVDQFTAAKEEYERSVKLNASSGALAVEQAQREVAALEEKVREGHVVAPEEGTLYSLPVRKGDFVKVGDLLAEMADLHKVRVRAFVDEPDIGALEPNEPVRITWDAYPTRSWQGRTEVVPKQVVTRGTRSVGELLCSVDNDKLELLPNVNVTVRINSRDRKDVLTIPRGAVEFDGTRRYVFLVKGGGLGAKSNLEKHEIRVGIADATRFEVTEGLTDKDLVALPGDLELRDGMSVVVTNLDSLNNEGR